MKIPSILGVIAVAVPLMSSASSPALYRINGGSTMQIDTSPISDVFSGTVNLSAGVCPHSCTLTLDVEITDLASLVTIFSINNAGVSGGMLCASAFVTFGSFPWTGVINHFQLPSPGGAPDVYDDVEFSLGMVDIDFPACSTHCRGAVTAIYNNNFGGLSYLSLDGVIPPVSGSGNCSMNSTVSSTNGNDYLIWH